MASSTTMNSNDGGEDSDKVVFLDSESSVKGGKTLARRGFTVVLSRLEAHLFSIHERLLLQYLTVQIIQATVKNPASPYFPLQVQPFHDVTLCRVRGKLIYELFFITTRRNSPP